MLEVDKAGLDHTDRRMLRTMIEKFAGGPVGLDTLAAAISEARDTIEDVYEPTSSSSASSTARRAAASSPRPLPPPRHPVSRKISKQSIREVSHLRLLLHMCCGPCSCYPVKKLREEGIEPVGYFFNPNIHPTKSGTCA